MTARVSRRSFLALAGALAGWTALPPAAVEALSLMDLMRTIVVDRESLGIFAEEYLRRHPKERGVTALTRLVFGEGEVRGDPRAVLREKIRGDFEGDRTVNLDGWIMSVTEVRFWCLYYLMTG